MSRHATDFQEEAVPSPPLPADHVLHSAAVLFPGAFDQHGCPLIVFPVDEQAKLSSELSKAEVVDFVNYFLCLHNKKQEKQSLVSVVADLKHASLLTTRVIAETLLLLELHKRTVHSVYIIQPKKKDVVRLLLKVLAPSKPYTASFKKVLLKEISELSNYIDRSQLTASLGGYLIYCHHSWVAFIKEIDEFVQEFLSVVQRLPSCISTLQALSRLAMPSTFSELQHFCSTNEAKFQQLRRELGLDELLSHCESVVEKLRHPEKEPCYQAMAGTALFTHTAFDMLQNHSRITAAVEKVELLWQQAFSKARLQLQVFQLREDALQITEQIKTLLQEKLQLYKIQIAKDATKAAMLVSEFEASIHTPAMALIRCAEDVIHTVAEILLVEGQTGERWVLDLERLKEKLHSAVHFILQTLRAVSNYHHHYNKANSWYSRVLCENVLQVLLSGVNGDHGGPAERQRRNLGTVPAWRYKVSTFLKKNPPPDVEALLHLAHLSNAIPDDEVREVGKQMSQRCMTLRKLLIGLGPVAVGHLQLALQWQYELLRNSHVNRPSVVDGATNGTAKVIQDPGKCESVKEAARLPRTSPSTAVSGMASAEAKPLSLSSFDSGFDGAGSSQLEACGGRDRVDGLSRLAGSRDSARPATTSQILKENISSVSDCEDHREEFDFGSVGNSSRNSIQIIPKVTVDSLNVEIKVKRSAALPNNPWLSLPVDDLEKSYTVTITQNPTPRKRNLRDPSEPRTDAESNGSRDQRTQTEVLGSAQAREPQSRDSMLHSQSRLEDPELSPIRNILSSTITDGRDESVCTTEGIPTLLWDSYDLHDQNQEAGDSVIDLSLNDWDVKEQEGLREVEKILDRADEILEKEENILAQEAVLDALLRSEDGHNQWPLWASENQLGVMSSSELAEAGVLGLEDDLDPAESDLLSEPRTGSASETKASEEDDGHCTEAATGAGAEAEAFHSRPDLLTELRNVHVLDELIREENLKIHALRSFKENSREKLSAGKPPDTNGSSLSISKEREAFRLQLEKEKREVEKLEKSLDKECNVKKRKGGVRRVVKCSIMERARSESQEDQALCDALLSGNRSQRTHSTSLVQNDSQVQETCETESIPAVLGPDVAKEAAPQDLVQLPDSQYQDDCCGAEPSVFNLVPSNSSCDLKETPEEVGIQPQGCIDGNKLDQALCDSLLSGSCSRSQRTDSTSLVQDDSQAQETCETESIPAVLGPDFAKEATPQDLVQLPDFQYQDDCCGAEPSVVNLVPLNSSSDLKDAPEEVGTQPQGCIDGHKLDRAGENASEMRPDDGAFDPGGKSHLPPVPKPRLKVSLPVNIDLAEHKPPHSKESSVALDLGFTQPDRRDEPLDALPESVTPAVNPNVKEQSSNNNNNNHALTETCSGSSQHLSNEITTEGEEDSSVVPACLPQTDLQPASEADQQSATAQLPPDQPREFDPGGGDEQNEEVPDGVQSSESMRIPGSGSAGIQAQLNINMREMSDFKTPIVLDTGSGLMKAGFADQDLPNIIFPTIIGMPKYEEIMNGNLEKETYIGHEAQHMRGVLALKHPIKNGIICNWDEMEKIWHHTFQQLGVEPEDHPVLLTEAAMNPLANRQRMVEIMFECFTVPFAYVAMQAVLALYAAGRSTGVVLDSGDGVSHSVPVFEGYCIPHAVQRFPLAGVDVTMHLKKLLQEQGVCMRSTAEMEIVREMKERCCCVAVNYEAELSQGGASCREMYYTMPDGQIVTLGTERFRAPEILFKPELIGRDHYGMHESVFKSILRSDIDLRRCFLGNIVLSGGNTLLPGFPERLQAEIKGLVPANMGDGVRVTSPKDRDFSVWSGGAVLANLPSFSSAWISQEEYEEYGPQIVFRKCF